MGTIISLMEGLPHYGHLLASTDSDAVAWCLNWNRGSADSSPHSWTENLVPQHGNTEDFLSDIMRNHFSLSSTRNLVARTHILLDVSPTGMGLDRLKACRAQCEALLLLCDMLHTVE